MGPAQSDFYVDAVRVTATGVEDDAVERYVQLNRRNRTAAAKALRAAGWKGRRVDSFVQANDTVDLRGWTYPGTAGARLRQFFPEEVLLVRNRNEVALERLRWSVDFGLGVGAVTRSPPGRDTLQPVVVEFLSRFISETGLSADLNEFPKTGPITVESFAERLGEKIWNAVREITATSWFRQHRQDLKFEGVLETFPLPSPLSDAVNEARRFFASGVRHLGPLRAPPQPLYGLPEAASGTSVGRDGEYTAAVLEAHSARRVLAPDPTTGEVHSVPLGESVNAWMAAMGLLSSVTSLERGKLGYEVHLRVEGVERDLDLTTVGVGVSQALPIVVLGLITPPGSVLLLEQPELHLHPDVQAVLGDFFLALARSGRQLIVETHSEYLINRLRRRAVERADVHDIVRLFFFRRKGMTSEVSHGQLGTNGAPIDWPPGFLDTAAREIEAIARERLKRAPTQ
jgi:AAA ATPase domain